MSQKVLLLEDVEHVGRKGDIAVVKSGYAFNFLLPKRFAEIASRAALRKQAKLQEERQLQAEQERSEALKIAESLKDETVEIKMLVDHEGHMYGSVSATNIVEQLKLKTGIELGKRAVQLKQSIKAIGEFPVEIKLNEGVLAQIQVVVTAQERE